MKVLYSKFDDIFKTKSNKIINNQFFKIFDAFILWKIIKLILSCFMDIIN